MVMMSFLMLLRVCKCTNEHANCKWKCENAERTEQRE